MANDCCSQGDILVFAFSGAANAGQVANQAAVDLQQEGDAKMLPSSARLLSPAARQPARERPCGARTNQMKHDCSGGSQCWC
jgi:uncharacterized metal-binding protein